MGIENSMKVTNASALADVFDTNYSSAAATPAKSAI
jgi:hypothetical protein